MQELYKAAQQGLRLTNWYGWQVKYLGIGKHLTVYNATPPLWLKVNGEIRHVSVGRVEHPDDRAHSRIMFFEQRSANECHLIPDAPVFYGEDPAVTTIGDEVVLSTVNVSAIRKSGYLLQTEIRRADDIMHLCNVWLRIPGKDNRFTPIDGTRVAVMTRPQGGEAGPGTMAYLELNNLDELSVNRLREARIVEFPKANDTWVGPNELHDLPKKNQIGILAHGAFNHAGTMPAINTYFIFFALMERQDLKIVDVEPLALREDFPASESKSPELTNVAFGTGLVIPSEPTLEYTELYAGIGDFAQAYARITNPKITRLYD